jgi:putative exosortase-associated protein (TIGR04073 family)
MQNKFPLLGVILMTSLLAAGCAGPEQKLSRGMDNTLEVVRWGEMRRSVEQGALFGPSTGNAVTGFNRSMARMGIGLYEMITFPIPSYDPIATKYLNPKPAYPDNFKPGLRDDSLFATDTHIGFDGGAIAPTMPGSRFCVFDN